jgi:hypothetical protein
MDEGRDEMDVIDERALVYVAVLFICSALAVFAGPARAAATFGAVAASIEGAYWLGRNLTAQYYVRDGSSVESASRVLAGGAATGKG